MILANERIKEQAKATAEQVASVVKEAAKSKGVAVHKEKVSQQIYVGPNLLGLQKYTVIESVKVSHIQTFIKNCPEVEKLFVPIDKMAETEGRIQQKGTLEHRYYNKVAEYNSNARKGE